MLMNQRVYTYLLLHTFEIPNKNKNIREVIANW